MSNPNLDDLDPDSPEYDQALEDAQNAELAELEANAGTTGEGETEGEDDDPNLRQEGQGEGEQQQPTDAAQAAEAAAAAEAAKSAEAGTTTAEADANADATKVAGVLGKDGKTVLPYAALAGTRRAAKQHRERAEAAERENEALRKQLEDVKAGRKPEKASADVPDLEGLTHEELEELKTDFPAMAKVVEVAQAALRRVADLEKKGAAAGKPEKTAEGNTEGKQEEDEGDDVIDAIDANPALLSWMHENPAAFERAKAHDTMLKTSPKWQDKPLHERFAHVTKLVADEFDIALKPGDFYEARQTQAPRNTPSQKPSKADTTAAIAAARRTEPNTLSDFKGGQVDQTEQRIERMAPQQLVNRFLDMDPEDIDAALAKLG